MLPESFPARGENLGKLWASSFESLDLSAFEPGKTLNSAVVAELTSGAKTLVSSHIEADATLSPEENVQVSLSRPSRPNPHLSLPLSLSAHACVRSTGL